MIALEVRRFSQANDAQGGSDGALGGGENRSGKQHLHMRPDALGEEWCERTEQDIIAGGRVCIGTSSWSSGPEHILLLYRGQMGKVEHRIPPLSLIERSRRWSRSYRMIAGCGD